MFIFFFPFQYKETMPSLSLVAILAPELEKEFIDLELDWAGEEIEKKKKKRKTKTKLPANVLEKVGYEMTQGQLKLVKI